MNRSHSPEYEQQLEDKVQSFKQLFNNLELPDLTICRSPETGFRMRAEFRIWHENGSAHYAMSNPGNKRPYVLQSFPNGSSHIQNLMPRLLEEINANPVLARRLFAAEFLTTLSGDALITLIYHRSLDEDWKFEALKLQSAIAVPIIGRSRKKKLVLERDFVTEVLNTFGREYRYQQIENSFTQPNAVINQQMLEWAEACTRKSRGDLLELYCGNGNFTVVLANNFDRVLATEVSKHSVQSARQNFLENGVTNCSVIRLSSEEFTQAINGVRPFRRLREVDLQSYNFSTVFVDPPRAGLDAGTLDLVSQFQHIVYISCNPQSLRRNVATLSQSHRIVKAAVFDQFPWTPHLEAGLYLSTR